MGKRTKRSKIKSLCEFFFFFVVHWCCIYIFPFIFIQTLESVLFQKWRVGFVQIQTLESRSFKKQ